MSERASDCRGCAVGQASGEGQGQFCPLIMREHQRGHVLCREGEDARYVWFVRDGQVDVEERGQVRRVGPGGFIGLEALVRDHYATTSRCATDATLCGATRDGMAQWLGPQHARACVIVRSLLERTTE